MNSCISSWIEYLNRENPEYVKCLKQDLKALFDSFKRGEYAFTNPWDMESCFTPYSLIKGKNNVAPNSDPEWVFQFNRLEWLQKVVLLHLIEGGEDLSLYWKLTVEKFYSKNQVPKKEALLYRIPILKKIQPYLNSTYAQGKRFPHYPVYRTLDTAIRNYHLMISHQFLFGDFKDNTFVRRILSDSSWTIDNLRPFDETSNWGIIIVGNHLLVNIIACFQTGPYLAKLEEMLDRQLFSAGAHIESSNMYHNHVLLTLMRLVYWLGKTGLQIPTSLMDATKRMAAYTYDMTGPDGYQICFGDSDRTDLGTLNFISALLLFQEVAKAPQRPDLWLLNEFDIKAPIHNE